MADIKETEYDPLTGITSRITYRDDGKVEVTKSQDIEPILERCYEARKHDEYTRSDLEHNANLYAHIPAIYVEKMLKDGIDLTDSLEMMKWVNKKHPELKTTPKWHGDSRASRGTSRIIVK